MLIDEEGSAKVTDFGIARTLEEDGLTADGRVLGTTDYVSPEQALGQPVSGQSDLYSVGVVLYELLTGNVPFTGDAPVEIAMKHLSTRAEPPSKQRPDVPRDLDLVVTRALAKDPAERYQSAEEIDADLERVGRGGVAHRHARGHGPTAGAREQAGGSEGCKRGVTAASDHRRLLRDVGFSSPAAGARLRISPNI